jgi:hypothetical protein
MRLRGWRLLLALVLTGAGLAGLVSVSALWLSYGRYGFNVLVRNGGTYWLRVGTDNPRLSHAMRLALAGPPTAKSGPFAWRTIKDGFAVGDLPVMANGEEVDHILLARIDPARFRFSVRSAPHGDKDLDQWMATLGAVLVVNGSYYGHFGEPATPVLSDGAALGPKDYDAKAGAFVSSGASTAIRDLAEGDWRAAFDGADNAIVSFPLLLANGVSRVAHASRWLANRSFVGEDAQGHIIIGTTTDAFFSLDRLARFLLDAPLGLSMALNLDGGPVACQGIALDGYRRKTYGRWEAQVDDGQVALLLTWPYGAPHMPVVLAVFPR